MKFHLIIKEGINNKFVDKVFEIIKKSLNYHPVNGISIKFADLDRYIDKRSGINIQLKKDGLLGVEFKEELMKLYGTTKDEASMLWDLSRLYLKKIKFIEDISEILYEDWIRWQENPYYIINGDYDDPDGKFNLKKLDDFIAFMYYVGLGKQYDAHSDESVNIIDELDDSDFEYIRSQLFDLIENETDSDFYSKWDEDVNTDFFDDEIITEDVDNEEEGELRNFTDDLLPKNVYEKFFKLFDRNPGGIFERLKELSLSPNEYDTYVLEYNLVYKYLTEYENRTPYYINIELDSDDISNFFYDDRDYNIRRMVKDFLEGDYEYDFFGECMDADSWLIDRIDKENMEFLREKYLEELEGESSEEDFMEFIESEYGTEIGCSASEAQQSADIDALHTDFMNGIKDYLSNLNGEINWDTQSIQRKFIGSIEIGELVNSPYFEDVVTDILDNSYPENFNEIFALIKNEEVDYGYSEQYNYFFPEELIRINTDRHFRYGGAGDIDWKYFNEILSDRLRFY